MIVRSYGNPYGEKIEALKKKIVDMEAEVLTLDIAGDYVGEHSKLCELEELKVSLSLYKQLGRPAPKKKKVDCEITVPRNINNKFNL